jgi:hypothetical protein
VDSLNGPSSADARDSRFSPENHETIMKLSYGRKVNEIINTLPRSVGADLAETKKKGEDPYPLTISALEDQVVLYIPASLPADHKDIEKISEVVSMIASLADKAGFSIKITSREVKPTVWNTYVALHECVKGAYFNLSRSEILPSSSIPSQYKTGWDYSLWYCFASGAKLKSDSGDSFLTIKRQTKLSPALGGIWSDKSNAAELLRLSTTIQIIAKHLADELGPLDRFLKKKGYFVENFCGKKPVAGIYTDSELELLTEEWQAKISRVTKRYDIIRGRDNVQDACGDSPGGLQDILGGFSEARSTRYKKIEETARSRIPDLLVETGKGKDKRKVIVKGATLGDKIIAINGGSSVRSVGKLLWSSEHAIPKAEWIDACMGQARSLNLRETPDWLARTIQRLGAAGADPTILEWYRRITPAIQHSAQIYLDCIQENSGNTTWDTTFGVRK